MLSVDIQKFGFAKADEIYIQYSMIVFQKIEIVARLSDQQKIFVTILPFPHAVEGRVKKINEQ